MKTCTRCGETKALTEFHRDRSRKDGLKQSCKPCTLAMNAEWAAANPEKVKKNNRRWRTSNPEAKRDLAQKWRTENPDKYREGHLRRTYDMTCEQYDAILAAQGGVCAICGRPPRKQRLVVDHCHKSRRVRGLIHSRENYVLGLLRDSADLAAGMADYLREPPAAVVLGPDHQTPDRPNRRRSKKPW